MGCKLIGYAIGGSIPSVLKIDIMSFLFFLLFKGIRVYISLGTSIIDVGLWNLFPWSIGTNAGRADS
jgi:hypothetical protein